MTRDGLHDRLQSVGGRHASRFMARRLEDPLRSGIADPGQSGDLETASMVFHAPGLYIM